MSVRALRAAAVGAAVFAGVAALDPVSGAGIARLGSLEHASRAARVPSYDLYASYPNPRRLRGWFLQGVNAYGSSTAGPSGTSLWFQPLAGGAFRQFNTAPFRDCHWDLLRWSPGKHGRLVYSSTHAGCYSVHTTIVFHPGIAYMPKLWRPGERWAVRGVSRTVYSEDGVAVCTGTNTWRSRVLGVAAVPGGGAAVHTQTNETQTLAAIAGAPSSAACPAGQTTSFGWQENFYVGADRLVRSNGGNLVAIRQAGHPEWDSVFSSWETLPPADVGTVTTAATSVSVGSSGNTIAFTYTAPSGGVQDATLAIAVPPGWTPPVTVDAVGCTTATAGSVTTSGQAITVSALTLPPNGRLGIVYGATSGGSCTALDGATAPSTPGAPVWQPKVTLTPGGPSTSLPSPPAIQVR
jgi:hypothetical protein